MRIAFTGHGLDRADHMRVDAAALAVARRQDDARVLVLDGLQPVLDAANALVWRGVSADDGELIFLGLAGGTPLFAPVPPEGDDRPAYLQRPAWKEISLLPAADLAIYGGARSLMDWHARHRFCARCGAPTHLAKGGWQRDCGTCQAMHFPRTDPVTIMLVENDGALLLGRGKNFPEHRYSALAGFVEPGESVEDAVAREVLEESGVRVHSVSYVASQPWPFPSQLMIGCHALADSRDLVVDYSELADARWFAREEVAAALAAPVDVGLGGELGQLAFLPPPPTAIARNLLEWWLERQ
ncbi:NAD(+) diphosphatase [Alteraurantiacibacter buctensis]|uniref:NAD(+) diphosphatase n=1 Tax=Alteraurantiacibacter buctensis TaxID=1503981 RepID=A0A844YZ15_9SPHN|nr:NAD(+) diphosphatase [Alteraurantiacibacter buctensis]MXO71327.1 NAD(+) diphosphatase [Alteraurantiacibacter buctensis]